MKIQSITYGLVSTLMAALLLAIGYAQASEFDGWYAGANLGANNATATSLPDKNSTYVGLMGGYNWSVKKYLVGVNGFYDAHDASYTKEDAGGDVTFALPMDSWLPYLKLGVASTTPGERLNGGLGLKFKFADKWAVNGEWKLDTIKKDGISYNNNNFVFGLSYYYDAGKKWASVETSIEK